MQKPEKLYYLCMLLAWLLCALPSPAQGLLFYGNEKRINERSCYTVFTDENRPSFSDEFHISFRYLVNRFESSGYILSFENANTDRVYSFTYVQNVDNYSTFLFNEEGKKAYHSFYLHNDNLEHRWIPVRISLYLNKNEAEVAFGDDVQRITGIDLAGKDFLPTIYFGRYGHLLDMASFSIQDVNVSDGRREWHFPLNESGGSDVHDSTGETLGTVVNPIWLINESYYWKEDFRHHSDKPFGVAFDTAGQQILLFNQDSLFTYHTVTGELTARPYTNPLPVMVVLGMSFMHPVTGELYVYEINNVPRGEPTVAALNLETLTWRTIGTDEIWVHRHHHTAWLDPEDERLIVFGGYGHRKYFNDFLRYDINRDRWDTLTLGGDRIDPRYFAGMAATPDNKRLYIYGGMGNETGDQNVGRNYYYDMYEADLESQNIRKLWSQEAPDINRVVARNMVVDSAGQYVYMLRYPEYLTESFIQLYKTSLADGTSEVLGDSIPLVSEEISTNVNLFYNPVLEKIYCAIYQYEDTGRSITSVYSINYPPVSLAAVNYYSSRAVARRPLWPWMLAVVAMLLGIAAFFWFRRKHRTVAEIPAPRPESPVAEVHEPPRADVFPSRRNAIYLFGNFAVFDREGRDITYMFSPKLRTTFLYILLKSVPGEGVLSSDLNELFWAGKPDEKVKNLKGVTMNHIRRILQDMDGIELKYQHGYFRLVPADGFYCDYLAFAALTAGGNPPGFSTGSVIELTDILSRGKFLVGIESELFDYYKHKTEDFIHLFLPPQIKKMYQEAMYDSVIRLCNMVFIIDPLSETALAYYVSACQKMNLPDKALKRYNTFAKEYRRTMGEDYKVAYEFCGL